MLAPDQIETFNRDGYLVLPDVLPLELLTRIRAEYSDLLQGLIKDWGLDHMAAESFETQLIAAYEAGYDWFQPLDISLPGDRIQADTPMHFGPAVFDMVRAPQILDIVDSLLGPEIESNPIQHVRIKPPARTLRETEARAHITSTDWHQDRAVGHQDADETNMVTVWLAITDATIENGCLQVKPFAGTQDMLPHCPQRQTAIASGYIDENDAVSLPVPAGGIVLLHPLVPHASRANISGGIRWSFDLRYNIAGQPSGRAHFPSFLARSSKHPDDVLNRWQDWRALWETARVDCAQNEHIEIHRWRSDAPACA